MSNEMLTTFCRGCGLPIGEDDIAASVMVRVWVPRLGQYRGKGPFHSDCGKRHDTQAQANLMTPNMQSDRRPATTDASKGDDE